MALTVVLLRIMLSAVFGVAGVTKLLDLDGTREAVKNFGAPAPLVPALSFLLPLLELAVAVGLLFDRVTSLGAFCALLLLGLFIVAISINLVQGRTHDCHCFGQLHSRPLGWPTLVRNIVFALGAGFVLWQTLGAAVPGIVPTLVELGLVSQLLLVAAAIVTVVMLVYLQRHAKQAEGDAAKTEATPTGLPLNSIAPAFELAAYHGGARSLAQLLAPGKPLLLIFTSPTCGPCVWLFQEIKDWQQAHSDQLTIGLISKGTIKDNFVNVARNSLGEVLLQKEREVAEQYNARVTPTAVVVNTSGRIASPLAAGADQIRNLLQTVLENSNDNNQHR
jgi:uncharacterized membrane protein YphA (DoxX/SURF4 family)/thiol-disulfide isomerase/thioredoxin